MHNGSAGKGIVSEEDEFEDVFGEFTSTAPQIKPPNKAGQSAGISLMDLEFEDGPHVPLPSTIAARTTPQKSAQQQKRTSGFFALNPAVLSKGGSPMRRSGTAQATPFYEMYKSKHEQLTPYIRVLRSCSTANSSALTSTISASHALSLLFPPTQNGPTPLDAQAYVLVDLLRFLSTAIEPTRDWGWLRRVLGGVCDRFEAVCLSAFDRAESATAVSMTRPQSAKSETSATAALRLVSEASWNVYRTTRETSPREKRYRSRAKEPPKTGLDASQSSTVTIVQELLDDQVEWELGRAWIEKREIFYESAKWEPAKNVVYVKSDAISPPLT
jgi:recyclin-1